ncbi:MAG: hypothetical protein RJA49_9, partial [Actinomycetota bacterium]
MLGLIAPPAHADDLAIKVRVQNQVPDAATGKTKKEPVAGVKVAVADANGAKIGEAVTDDKGIATIAVPGQADYKVTLDESTLPEGFALQEGGPDRQVGKDSFITSTVTVTYFTGAANRATVGWWAQLAQRIVDGTRFGLILAMCAVGLSLIYGTTGLTNFAHGEMVTFGAMIAYILNTDQSITPWIAFPVAIIAGGAFGLAQNQLIYSPLRK